MNSVRRARLGALAAAAVTVAMPLTGFAQFSGSWTFNGDGNWSDVSKWSSNPSYPDAGGVASFNLLRCR